MKTISHHLCVCCVVFFVLATAPLAATGDTHDRAKTKYFLSYAPMQQFEADLESENSFSVTRHFFRFDTMHPVNKKMSVGLGIGFDHERWNFDSGYPVVQTTPWSSVNRASFGLPLLYRLESGVGIGLTPVVEFAGESGTDIDKGLAYGATVNMFYPVHSSLSLGLGLAYFNRLEDTSFFPYLIVDWQITEALRLKNPFRAGPAGPAGLELVYSPAPDWEFGFGSAYRSFRFRLDESNSLKNGIVQNKIITTFARVQRQFGKTFAINLYGGMLFGGELQIDDEDGNELGEQEYDDVPFAALTVSAKF